MSAHVEVIATDFRRAKVKVTPGTYLVDVLREACQKLNLSSDKYLLKHKQKQLDLAAPFRTFGLPSGAKLELVAKSSSPSVINVALQFSGRDAAVIPNGRLMGKFSSDFTLWKILRQFESGEASGGHNLNITARGTAKTDSGGPLSQAMSGSGQLYYESPVLNIMGRELSTLEDLQKTLSQCGINSGSVLIRVSFQATARTLYEAMEDISRYMNELEPETTKKDEDAYTAPAVAEESKESLPVPAPVAGTASSSMPTQDTPASADPTSKPAPPSPLSSQQIPESMDIDSHPSPSLPSNPLLPVSIFAAPKGPVPAAALMPVDDSAFTPTIAHAQLHQARLLASSQNKRLKSDAELEAEAAAERARLEAVKSLSIKVRFPDGTSAQWTFPPDVTGSTLFQAVRSLMAFEKEPFKLVLPGGKRIILDAGDAEHELVKGYGLRGRVLLNLTWEEGASAQAREKAFLKSSVASRAQEVVVMEVKMAEDEEDGEDEKGKKPVKKGGSESGGGGGEGGLSKKLPKWLKLGKK